MCPLSSRQGAHYCGGVIRIFCNAIMSYWTVGDTDPYKKNQIPYESRLLRHGFVFRQGDLYFCHVFSIILISAVTSRRKGARAVIRAVCLGLGREIRKTACSAVTYRLVRV